MRQRGHHGDIFGGYLADDLTLILCRCRPSSLPSLQGLPSSGLVGAEHGVCPVFSMLWPTIEGQKLETLGRLMTHYPDSNGCHEVGRSGSG